MKPCPFCSFDQSSVLHENEYVYAISDGYPVTKGHALIIPKRHVDSFFDLTDEERHAASDAIFTVKQQLDACHVPDGYNIGINVGEAAGQTVHHVHIHLIPRYKDDMQDPRGGVRGVIPSKQKYVK